MIERVHKAEGAINGLMRLLVEMYSLILRARPDLDTPEWLLLAGIKKSTALAETTTVIAELGVVEVIWSIVRTLSELIVNLAYLTVATPIELSRFLNFDQAKMFKQTTTLRNHVPEPVAYPPELLKLFAKKAQDVQVSIERKDNNLSWSQYPLIDRASLADKHSEQKAFATLVLSCAAQGNSGTHATMASMVWYVESVASGSAELDDERVSALGLALEQVAFALSILCHHIDQRFSLGKQDVIVRTAHFGPNGLRPQGK